MRIVSPAPLQRFTIATDTTPPAIAFATDGTGPHVWEWTFEWRTYRQTGRVQTAGNRWAAQAEFADLGGRLTVRATAGRESAGVTVNVVGANPTAQQLSAYLTAQADSDGFLAIIQHESRGAHFEPNGEPIRSFDGGYGMCQLTTPAPSYQQCWSWKRNVLGGLTLFAEKRRAAITYLRQSGRTYTAEQLRRETVARWNGGAYHRWDGRQWERNPDILCDPNTGNIGWNMTDPDNAGQTLAQLRARDGAAFRRGRTAGANWIYSGVCYADALLGA